MLRGPHARPALKRVCPERRDIRNWHDGKRGLASHGACAREVRLTEKIKKLDASLAKRELRGECIDGSGGYTQVREKRGGPAHHRPSSLDQRVQGSTGTSATGVPVAVFATTFVVEAIQGHFPYVSTVS